MNEYQKKLLKKAGCEFENELATINWASICEYKTLSEEFIREFDCYLNWAYISSFQKLSEDFIREFQDKVKWYRISADQQLSESFIREFQDRVSWLSVSTDQHLSDTFLLEFQHKILWKWYFGSRKSTFSIMKQFICKTDYKSVLDDFKISHLSEPQQQEIERLLTFKHVFSK